MSQLFVMKDPGAIVDPGGEPDLAFEYTLTRDDEINVIEDHQFVDSDIVEQEDRCRGGWNDEEQCLETPEECEDCDSNGVLECWSGNDGWCETVNYIEVVDECVPPGQVEYWFYWGNVDLDHDGLDVSDSGEDCGSNTDVDSDTDGDTDSDADSDGDADFDSDGGDGGCSVSGAGAGSGSGPLAALVMLGIGLIAARMRRR